MRYEDWRAQMPEQEVDERIDWHQRELAFLLAAKAAPRAGAVASPIPEMTEQADAAEPSQATLRPLTEDRLRIARIMLGVPRQTARPQFVADAIRQTGAPVEDRHVQIRMQRMAEAGQLLRVHKGVYKLPPATAALVRDEEPARNGLNGHDAQVVMQS